MSQTPPSVPQMPALKLDTSLGALFIGLFLSTAWVHTGFTLGYDDLLWVLGYGGSVVRKPIGMSIFSPKVPVS